MEKRREKEETLVSGKQVTERHNTSLTEGYHCVWAWWVIVIAQCEGLMPQPGAHSLQFLPQ